MSALIGRDVQTDDDISISDIARRSGLYILGKPGMGKSSLITQLALQDIKNGHGIFFLDPHSEAIDVITHHPSFRPFREAADLLNPFTDFCSFGINLLACDNINSLEARTDTYTRAYNLFARIWGDSWGPWLPLGLQHILKAFIENPDYKLADVPLFLDVRNTAFRNHIVSNITREPAVAAFWRQEFSLRRDRDQQERVDAALTRVNTLLGHQHIRHIVGQRETTVDFALSMAKRRLLLVEIPAHLPDDIKTFVGTLIISELLHAVRTRPSDDRPQFCIFVDEFQHFATDDFATLITEARKYGVATTIAYQERFGQFYENSNILGATAAAANKVFFQLTVKDAQELAPEFAPKPGEVEVFKGVLISPTAIEDIWDRGHPNPAMMDIRESYLWIVDLLRSAPQDGFYMFQPSLITGKYPIDISLDMLYWNEFHDWDMYRSSPDMLKQAIALLNKYYYDWMHHKYTPALVTNEQVSLIMTVVDCVSGVFGFRPAMRFMPSDTARTLMQAVVNKEYEERKREWERGTLSYGKVGEEDDNPWEILIQRYGGFSTQALEDMIRREFPHTEPARLYEWNQR